MKVQTEVSAKNNNTKRQQLHRQHVTDYNNIGSEHIQDSKECLFIKT